MSRLAVVALVVALASVGVYYVVLNKGDNGNSSATTAQDVATGHDLTGKVVLITGAGTGGIGYETARVMAMHGAHVFVHGRSEARVSETIEALRQEYSLARVDDLQLSPIIGDLSSLDEVKGMAEQFTATGLALDILICNAGVMAQPERWATKDGLEWQAGINHVSHALLASLLLEPLKAAGNARVLAVSSSAHRWGNATALLQPDLESKPYAPFVNYGTSKFMNIAWARAFHERYAQSHGITAVSLHPGVISTRLGRDVKFTPFMVAMIPLFMLKLKSLAQGAATSVYCAVTPELQGGAFYEDAHISTVKPSLAEHLEDADYLRQFWAATEGVVGQEL